MYRYLIVGKPFKNLRDKILERGDDYTLLQDIVTTKFPDKKFKRRVLADFSSRDKILNAVRGLDGHFDGVVTVYENYVLPAAWIAEELGLPGLPVDSAEACTDKFTMRSLFSKTPEKISPAFKEITSKEELRVFAEEFGFPLIIKPANLAKSLLVTKSRDQNELMRNFERTMAQIDEVYKRYSPHRSPKVIVEEFMSGSIHSVDAFIDHEGTPHVLQNIVDYQTGYDIGFEDNFHYSRLLPSHLPQNDQDRLRYVADLGARSLGMRSTPAHIEIVMTETGPQIVEIGARNGGYRERMHGLANGIDISGAALDLAVGKPPQVEPSKNENCAVLELFPKFPGKFDGLAEEENLKKLPSFNYLSIKPKPGQFVGKSSDGYKMCAIVILYNPDSEQFAADLDFVNRNVFVKTAT